MKETLTVVFANQNTGMLNFFEKTLACFQNIMYTIKCCGMIAMKREVAALPRGTAGFPWSECQEGRL